MGILFRKSKECIAWVVPSSSRNPDKHLASVWIRSLQMVPYLEEMGFNCTLNRLFPNPAIAIFLRRYSNEDVKLASKLKSKGTKIVLEVIVNYFEVYSSNEQGYGVCNKEQHYNFMKLVELADEIWCASPFLKYIADKYHPNVVFVSDSIDHKHFSQRKHYKVISKPLRIGWSGVSVKAHTLNMFEPWISNDAVSLCVISEKPPKLEVPYEFIKWSYKRFPMDIVNCDLCVAPRKFDNNYDRGHSLFKIGVFMTEGIPALASPVPSYELILGDGKGGHICRTSEEWNEYIEICLNDENVLKRWSGEAVKSSEPYSTLNISKQIAKRIKFLQEMECRFESKLSDETIYKENSS